MIIIHVRKLIPVENGGEKNRGGKKWRIGIKENRERGLLCAFRW